MKWYEKTPASPGQGNEGNNGGERGTRKRRREWREGNTREERHDGEQQRCMVQRHGQQRKAKRKETLEVNVMRVLRWMCGVTKKDKIRNEHVRRSAKVAPVTKTITEKG